MKNLYAALLHAQRDMPALLKDKTNPAFRASYASLAAVQEAAFPTLNKHGLLVMQSARSEYIEGAGWMVHVGVSLVHAESGESIMQELSLAPAKSDPQGMGSAITYGRRFVLMTILGMAPDDDDGQAASNGAQPAKAQPGARPQPAQAKPAAQAAKPAQEPDNGEAPSDALAKAFHAVGSDLYGGGWDAKRGELARSITKGRTGSSKELTRAEMSTLLDGMKSKQAEAAAAQPALDAALAQPAGKPSAAAANYRN